MLRVHPGPHSIMFTMFYNVYNAYNVCNVCNVYNINNVCNVCNVLKCLQCFTMFTMFTMFSMFTMSTMFYWIIWEFSQNAGPTLHPLLANKVMVYFASKVLGNILGKIGKIPNNPIFLGLHQIRFLC